VGEELLTNQAVDGFIFTGSREVGMEVYRRFTKDYPRPCIAEMGGKNPALIMPSANIEDAAEGVLRSAFGMGGQKCSACSRVYVHKQIAKAFIECLVEKASAIKIGDPARRETFLGPLINKAAVAKYRKALGLGQREGRVQLGGSTENAEEWKHGFYVQPAVITKAPKGSKLFREEYFAPVVAVAEVKSLDEAIELANDSDYGLTAGIFTNDPEERAAFFNRIEAGVSYCNRRGGATTGAWPGIQSFGGWKGSGSSGKNALGPNYVAQLMREQSQTEIGS
jgi:1-pyrroline-5-carboxylate dehydrogenase